MNLQRFQKEKNIQKKVEKILISYGNKKYIICSNFEQIDFLYVFNLSGKSVFSVFVKNKGDEYQAFEYPANSVISLKMHFTQKVFRLQDRLFTPIVMGAKRFCGITASVRYQYINISKCYWFSC